MDVKTNKRILVATGLYPPEIGGPATYAKMLEAELPKAGIEPVVLPFGTVRHLPKVIRHIAFARALFRLARTCDAIYALDSISVGIPALLVAKLSRKPFLIRLGGDYAWEQGRLRFGLTTTLDEYTADTSGRPLMVRLLARLQSIVVRRAKYVVAPSEYLKSVITTWGVSEGKVIVIHSALFPLPVTESRVEIRHRLSYNGTVLISAARLTPWKGFSQLIEMVAVLKDEIEELSLVIAGGGELRETLEEKARQAGVADRVRFVGPLSKEALGAAISGADAFVYNTSYEGLPHQLLEVMDLGIPIVTTNIGGNREIIKDGVQGLLVEPNNVEELVSATKRVLMKEELRKRLTQNARLKSKEFTQEKVTSKLIELLQSVVKK